MGGITLGGGRFNPEDQEALNKRAQAQVDQEQMNQEMARAKFDLDRYLAKGRPTASGGFSIERGPRPGEARKRLAERGVDVEGFLENKPTDSDMKKGGKVKGYAKGGSVSSASKRADGIAQRGKTRGTIVACGGGYMKGKK